ncbi:MAG: glycosyltransferase family 4 protein [Muribaculaceae bacterium]|nr:glycosyltransferase family 4 protein [Muribaculaceae bacterium]
MEKQLLLIINEDRFFLSHRRRIAEMARERGWDVTLVTKDTGRKKEIIDSGFKYIELPINPTGMNPKDELRLLNFLIGLLRRNNEALVHLVGLKNMLWGGVAARLVKTKGVVFAVSGLGTLFGEENSPLISKAIQSVLKVGMHLKNGAVIFQNHDDEELFVKKKIIGNCEKYFIKGSGVELNQFYKNKKTDEEPLKIIFTARMLQEKGVEDLVAAAELLRKDYEGKVEFLLCGDLSANPRALKRSDLERITDGRYIKWMGHCENVPELLANADIMCFPSFYREGVPKSLLEASASSLPIITTDSIGCRDTVEHGKNGFIVPAHSPEKLAEALRTLIENKELREEMGAYSRKKAEKDYNVEDVAEKHMEIYTNLSQR